MQKGVQTYRNARVGADTGTGHHEDLLGFPEGICNLLQKLARLRQHVAGRHFQGVLCRGVRSRQDVEIQETGRVYSSIAGVDIGREERDGC